jgi:[ribosomal protein S5]-alanine N-acetyltransferase
MPYTFLETPRLILREWQESDYAPFIRLNADPEVMEYFAAVRTAEETMAQIGRIVANMKKLGYGFFAVERKDNGQFIGFTGLTNAPFESWFTPCVEIGWRLSRENWGYGFATEAAKACLDYGFDRLALTEIYSFTSIHNTRSEQVMKKIGMAKEGVFNHPSVADGSWLKPHVLYKISR